MGKWIVLFAMFPLLLLLCVGQWESPQSPVTVMRPVKLLPSPTPSSGEIHFSSFEFQQIFITNHLGSMAIKGEPTKGARFVVEAKLYGEEAIATAKFEAVDERGNVIQKISIERRADANGGSGFYGVMKVPDRPFRVVITGEGIDGLRYRRPYERLFRPSTLPLSPILIPPGATATEASGLKELEVAAKEYMNKMEEELNKTAGEMIVMPHMRVSNVMYAPFLSKAGRPLGVRITLDVEFSQDGYYNPELHIYPDYRNPDWRGWINMKPLTGSIEPLPAEEGSPQDQPHILAYGAGYLYRAGTPYHFTAEYVPDYVIQNEKKTKFCIWNQQYKYSPETQASWKTILASAAPTKYTLYINNTNFGGEIESLHPQGVLFNSFVAEGAKDCGEQPTKRF
jgi:hypothetical protein